MAKCEVVSFGTLPHVFWVIYRMLSRVLSRLFTRVVWRVLSRVFSRVPSRVLSEGSGNRFGLSLSWSDFCPLKSHRKAELGSNISSLQHSLFSVTYGAGNLSFQTVMFVWHSLFVTHHPLGQPSLLIQPWHRLKPVSHYHFPSRSKSAKMYILCEC